MKKLLQYISPLALALLVSATSFAQTNSLWGMTQNGGTGRTTMGYTAGVIFEFNPATGSYTKWYDLSRASGCMPTGSLLYYNNKLYGLTAYGGTNDVGVLFEFDPITKIYTKKHEFNTTDGAFPNGGLIAYNNKLYGMTHNGGVHGSGTLFEYDPATANLTAKYSFDNNGLAGNPYGNLVVYNNIMYAVASGGGNNYGGELFTYNPVTGTVTAKASFTTGSGMVPMGALVLYGTKLYGTASNGGTGGYGTIFEYDTSVSNIITPDYNFSNGSNTPAGATPSGDLTIYNGKMYGLTSIAGPNGQGTLFQFDPVSKAVSVKYSFTGTGLTDGPLGSLSLLNGKFYGMTFGDGASDSGTIFSFDPASGVYTRMYDFNGVDGARPVYTQLTAAPATPTAISSINQTIYTKVYPNPATDVVIIHLNDLQQATFILTDITGKEVMNNKISKGSNSLDVQALARGTYQYRILDASGGLLGSSQLTKK